MIISFSEQLTAFLLLVAVLLAPINSFAHDVTSGAAQDACVCLLLSAECGTDERGDQPLHFPANNADEHCDNEDCCPDTAEPPVISTLRVNILVRQFSHPLINGLLPEVYLAIFVPPEN